MELQTNGSPLIVNQKCTVPGFGLAWFSDKSVTNIFSFAENADKFRITYDNYNQKDAFIVHAPKGPVEFKRAVNKLYIFKPELVNGKVPKCFMQSTVVNSKLVPMCNVTTLEENKKFYTKRQFARAKASRDFYHCMGTPSIPDLLAALWMNLVKNNPITLQDVKLAENIFGPDVGTIKGKTTRRKPLPVVQDYIEIPKELLPAQEDVTVALDGMNVNSFSFLTTISRNIFYRTAHYLPSRHAPIYKSVINSVIVVYK